MLMIKAYVRFDLAASGRGGVLAEPDPVIFNDATKTVHVENSM